MSALTRESRRIFLTDIIGKTNDELRELDPDVDEMSWRGVCYV
jgi:hypothetical protein